MNMLSFVIKLVQRQIMSIFIPTYFLCTSRTILENKSGPAQCPPSTIMQTQVSEHEEGFTQTKSEK